jgi:hypothetical protein
LEKIAITILTETAIPEKTFKNSLKYAVELRKDNPELKDTLHNIKAIGTQDPQCTRGSGVAFLVSAVIASKIRRISRHDGYGITIEIAGNQEEAP